MGKGNEFTSIDDKDEPAVIHVDVQKGYNYGVLKSYKESDN
jgi:hypothetical protein